jgi:hypothetical protein
MQLLRPDAPVAIRATISAIGFATCLAAAIAVPQGMTHDSVARFAATYALVTLALGMLSLAGTPRWPRLPLFVTLGVAMVTACYVLYSFGPMVPIRRSAFGGQESLIITILLGCAVLAALRTGARWVFALLVALAIKGVLDVAVGVLIASEVALPAGAQLFLVLNAVWILGSIVAVWYGRGLRRHRVLAVQR